MCVFLNSVCLLFRDTLVAHVRVFRIPLVEAEVTPQHRLGSLPDLNWHRKEYFPLVGDL